MRPHTHVVATDKANQRGDPLWVDLDDLKDLSDRAHKRAKEQERGPRLDRDSDRERDRDREYGPW